MDIQLQSRISQFVFMFRHSKFTKAAMESSADVMSFVKGLFGDSEEVRVASVFQPRLDFPLGISSVGGFLCLWAPLFHCFDTPLCPVRR